MASNPHPTLRGVSPRPGLSHRWALGDCMPDTGLRSLRRGVRNRNAPSPAATGFWRQKCLGRVNKYINPQAEPQRPLATLRKSSALGTDSTQTTLWLTAPLCPCMNLPFVSEKIWHPGNKTLGGRPPRLWSPSRCSSPTGGLSNPACGTEGRLWTRQTGSGANLTEGVLSTQPHPNPPKYPTIFEQPSRSVLSYFILPSFIRLSNLSAVLANNVSKSGFENFP